MRKPDPNIQTVKDGNVGVKVGDMKRGRDVCLYRQFEDAGGIREFTLWLDRDEFERLLDCGDDILAQLEQAG